MWILPLVVLGVLVTVARRREGRLELEGLPARGHASGQALDPKERARREISGMIESASDALRRIREASFPWGDVAKHGRAVMAYQALGNRNVAQIGPALDSLTHGASQPATHHAWMLNGQLAALDADATSWNTGEPVFTTHRMHLAESLAREMLSDYANALAAV